MNQVVKTISKLSELRQLYGEPSDVSQNKVVTKLDKHLQQFLSLATLAGISLHLPDNRVLPLMAGADKGLFELLSDTHIRISLNHVDDAFKHAASNNIDKTPVGLIAMIPGVKETARLQGVGEFQSINKQEYLLIDIDKAFLHCAKAFMRSKLWGYEPGALWQGWREFVCVDRQIESSVITSFYLEPADGRLLPEYQPGQHVLVNIDIPGQQNPVTRSYSLSDCTDSNRFRISVKREPKPAVGSRFLHKHLTPGERIKLKAPRGRFVLNTDPKQPVVLLSGGVGITPMLAMLNHIATRDKDRETWFIHAAISSREHAFAEHVKQLYHAHENIHTHICYDSPAQNDIQGVHYHTKGRITIELLETLLPWRDFEFYLCGPKPFMQALGQGLLERGIPKKRILWEAFGGDGFNPLQTQDEAERENKHNPVNTETVSVTFQKSAKTVQWQSSQKSLLDLALANNIPASYSCRSGDCHTCSYKLIKGDIRYLEQPEEAPQPGYILLCQSIPDGNVTIDI